MRRHILSTTFLINTTQGYFILALIKSIALIYLEMRARLVKTKMKESRR